MTSLAAPKPTKQSKLAHLANIARDLAPALYGAECAFLGVANTATPFASLSQDQQAVYRERAIVTVLGGIGWISGKANERAIVLAVMDATADNGGAFAESAQRLLESVAGDALRRADGLLVKAWLELER